MMMIEQKKIQARPTDGAPFSSFTVFAHCEADK